MLIKTATGDLFLDPMHEVFEAVARYFSVLGEPTRLRILHALCQEEKCVNEIIRITGMAQANISRHLGLMYQAGMLARRREGTQIFYRVADPIYTELCRTVTAQVLPRSERLGVESPPLFADDVVTALAAATPDSLSPANQKEKASV